MKRNLFIILFILNAILCFPVVEETASFKEFLYGSTEDCEYDNWVSHVSEGIVVEDYNLYAPYDRQTNGFGDFNIASTWELDSWENVIDYFVIGELDIAQSYLNSYNFPFQVVEFYDIDTDRTYYMIRECLNFGYYDNNGTTTLEDDENGSFDYGWGLYVYNPNSLNPIIITAPHPNDDYTTSAVAYKCFKDWDAMFLMISGAGREVEWTEIGSYTNSKSLSDPSRNTQHAFTKAYYIFCDKIREDFGQREFSAQIHSYDWNRHANHANCQISAGYHQYCPNLPIRDLSDLKHDVINASSYLVHPANVIGNNHEVYINDFYSVNYSTYGFTYSNEDTTFAVNNQVDLEGYSQNRQMLYSFSGWNVYDVFEPFFHLEMDELPDCYDQVEENLNWFYAFDPVTETFDMDSLFCLTLQYFEPFINAMTETLPQVLELEDDLVPNTPRNFVVDEIGYDFVTLNWEVISSFDFETYEILFATEPIGEDNYEFIDRNDAAFLASQRANSITIEGLEGNQVYFFEIRAKDYNDNYSELSEAVVNVTSPAVLSDFYAVGQDSRNSVHWTAEEQVGNQGFRVYRKIDGGEYEMIASYLTNPELLGSTQPDLEYIFEDNTVINGEFYTYRISSVNYFDMEYYYDYNCHCSPRPVYKLIVSQMISISDPVIVDSVAFSSNPYATFGYDEHYDIYKSDEIPPEYIYAAFYEGNWGSSGVYLAQEVHGYFDPETFYKIWDLKVKTNQLNQLIEINVSSNYLRDSEKLYLRDCQTDTLVNLAESSLFFTAVDTNFLNFRLYWGNLKPQVYFLTAPNRIYQGNEEMTVGWTANYATLIDHVDICLKNDTDSLLIASDLDYTITEFSWIVPTFMEMHNARFFLEVYTIHDEIVERYSSHRVGFVPLLQYIEPDIGWQMITNPWIDFDLDIDQIFINEAELYLYNDSLLYIPAEQIVFGEGYWLNIPEPNNFTHNGSIMGTQYTTELHHGWNLLANPHLCSYEIKNFRFDLGIDSYSFSQAVTNQFISNAFYIYKYGSYHKVDQVEPKKSFLIYSYLEDSTDLTCIFKPYNFSYYTPLDLGWQLKVTATQENADSDELVLGAYEHTTSEFDYSYDLPEPPSKPFEEGVEFYFPKTDTLFLYDKLNWEYKELLSNSEPEEKIWDFELKINSLEPIDFEPEFMEFPEGYRAILSINSNETELMDGEIFTLIPEETGIINGEIRILNHLFVNSEDETPGFVRFCIFPNPFNPETNIVFSLLEDTHVELTIYNIKGQKVRTICNEMLGKGNYIYVWNGKDKNNLPVASGIYFSEFETDGIIKIKKMLLLK